MCVNVRAFSQISTCLHIFVIENVCIFHTCKHQLELETVSCDATRQYGDANSSFIIEKQYSKSAELPLLLIGIKIVPSCSIQEYVTEKYLKI